MLDTRVSSKWCNFCRTSPGGLTWPHRCAKWSAAVCDPILMHLHQSTNAAHHCHHSFGAATHRLHEHWDENRAAPTTKCGECSGFLWSLYETHHGLHDPKPNCKDHCLISMAGIHLNLWSPSQAPEWSGHQFESNIIKELCELMDIQKVRTSPYHVQTNRQVEWAHQILMHMIEELSKDQKADWPKHLPE